MTAPIVPAASAAPSAVAPEAAARSASNAHSAPRIDDAPWTAPLPVPTDLTEAAPAVEAVPSRRGRKAAIAAGAAAVLIAAAVMFERQTPAPAPSEQPPAEVASAPIERAPQVPAGAGAPVEPAAVPPAASVNRPASPAELTVLRRVWVRVIVDGRRAVEGELQADAHVPLGPGRTIVIRAGDAGAIRLAINGKDQGPLGGDGEVVTRTFTAPAPASR